MITVRLEGKEYEIKSRMDEINISEFDEINNIISDEKMNSTNQRIEMLKKLGLPNEVANNLGYKSLLKISQEVMTEKTDGKIHDVITIDGEEYNRIGGEDFDLNAGQVARIEEALKHDDRTARVVSIVYNIDKDLASQKVTADIAMPLVIECENQFLEALNEVK